MEKIEKRGKKTRGECKIKVGSCFTFLFYGFSFESSIRSTFLFLSFAFKIISSFESSYAPAIGAIPFCALSRCPS